MRKLLSYITARIFGSPRSKLKQRLPNKSNVVIDETDELRLEHEFEATFLVKKESNEVLITAEFYGVPECGLIDKANNWAIVAGDFLLLWTPNFVKKYHDDTFRDFHALRCKSQNIVEVLTDPWSDFSAIWELNTINGEVLKISDFKKAKGIEYTDDIDW